MGRSIFITGTDTGVGKTFFTSGLIRALRKQGVDAVGFKPIECGGRSDSAALLEASGGKHSLDEINPVWLEKPLAPLAAADSEDDLPLGLIKQAHRKLISRHELVLVEGAGGWLVPVTAELTMADLAAEMCEEVILVAANRLGVVNHTLLTLQAIKEKKLKCSRVVLNFLPLINRNGSDISVSSNSSSIRLCAPLVQLFELEDEVCFGLIARAVFSDQ